jgi:hypothetical protein
MIVGAQPFSVFSKKTPVFKMVTKREWPVNIDISPLTAGNITWLHAVISWEMSGDRSRTVKVIIAPYT